MQKQIKKTPDEWYNYLWSPNSAFRCMPPSEANKNKKITKDKFWEMYVM